ncbi:MAG: cytoplasmic protein, partial [Thiohalophilus sp.]
DPHWYEVYAHIKNGLSEDSDGFKKFINEGLEKTPNYYQLYFAAVDYLAPKWHGSKEEIEKFANKAVERTKENEGMALYARIYWYASQTQYDERLFSESDVVWDKMREGIFDVLEDYPDSWNIQNFAFFSCLARDQSTTRILLEKMKRPMIKRAWKKRDYYEYCKNYAYAIPDSV